MEKNDQIFWLMFLFFGTAWMVGFNTGVGFGFLDVDELMPISGIFTIILIGISAYVFREELHKLLK